MSYVGKILWIDGVTNPKPYLCVFEFSDKATNRIALEMLDLEHADVLTVFEVDINTLIQQGRVNWDD